MGAVPSDEHDRHVRPPARLGHCRHGGRRHLRPVLRQPLLCWPDHSDVHGDRRQRQPLWPKPIHDNRVPDTWLITEPTAEETEFACSWGGVMTAAELGEAKQAPEFDQVAYYHCWTPCPVPLAVLVRVAGLSGWPEPLHVIPMAKEPYR